MTGVDRVDALAQAAFADRYGAADLGPIAVIIPAYREEASIAAVVRDVPPVVHARRVATLVVVDGAEDRSADVAADAGAYVCETAVNRGQGRALRLGYRLAVAHGARYLVSLDADGQYEAADIPSVLAPILADRADFVSGSRRLGSTYRGDGFRRLGVTCYAALISALTRHRVTDPSFGLRAMRAEVVESVRLDQPQFQASELLVGAIMRGFRVTEVPATMRRRASGTSRKGPDLVYGYRFGRVVVSTWWRERRTRG